MQIQQILAHTRENLRVERALLVSEILLSHFLQKPRIYLHTHFDECVNESVILAMKQSIERLNDGYPLEYITNKASFYSQDFYIAEGALIPRPETELLVDKASEIILREKLLKIYEIGVGSGIISIILALKHRDLEIIATDISPNALNIARINIAKKAAQDSTLQSRIKLVQTNLLDGVDYDKNTLIVSNPPYISGDYEIPLNLTFEPQVALFGGKSGDEILRDIIALDFKHLACEIGYNQRGIEKYLTNYESVEFYSDYSGFTRGFVANQK